MTTHEITLLDCELEYDKLCNKIQELAFLGGQADSNLNNLKKIEFFINNLK
jgi:hypothetical protein